MVGSSFPGTSSIDLARSAGIATMLEPESNTIDRVNVLLSVTSTIGTSFSIFTSTVSLETVARSRLSWASSGCGSSARCSSSMAPASECQSCPAAARPR